MKLLYLTSVVTFANEKGQDRIDKALKKEREDDDEPGYLTKKWYTSQNLRPPPDLEDEENVGEIDEDGMFYLESDELDYDFLDLVVSLEEFSSCEENGLIGSQLYTKSGEVFHIEETPEQLFQYITVITRPWHEKITDWVKIKLKININK